MMLRSSLGFHTITMSLALCIEDIKQLILDFVNYRKNTNSIQIYLRNGKNEPVIYHYNEAYLPRKIEIYYKEIYRGIKWRIRSADVGWGFGKYIVEATINPKILSNTIDYITAANFFDFNIAMINFNTESNKISPLLKSFTDYKITRIDYCANISLDDVLPGYDPALIIDLIKRSNIPPHFDEWMQYDEKAHRMKSKPESFYLKNSSVTINYYSKYLQLQNRSQENVEKGYKPLSPEELDKARNIIRLETQCKYHRIYSLSQEAEESGNHDFNKYKYLLSPVKCVEIVSDYYKKVIGKGDWYTFQEAIQIIKSKNFNAQKEKRLIDALQLVSQCRSLAKAKNTFQGQKLEAFKRTIKELHELNINPVTIPREWGIKHIPNLLQSFFISVLEGFCNHTTKTYDVDSSVYKGYGDYLKKFGHPPI